MIFASYQNNAGSELVHDIIPYFGVALAGIEKGYRHCFRRTFANLEEFAVFAGL